MAGFVRRWRAPLLGVAIWLLSFPLLTAHPTPVTLAAAHLSRPVDVEANDHRLVRQIGRERLAIAASEAAAAAASASLVPAPPDNGAPQTAPAPRSAAPVVRANTIVIPRLGLSLPVGWYGDCLGRAAVPRWGAWRWSCAGANNTYIMAHNPGTFTPILGLRAGDIVEYGDPSARVHTYRVSYTTIVSNTQLWPLGATSSSTLTLQTCWTWDGSRDFIVRALEL
jgi:sortase (surface protein transpeptidase)